MCKADNLTTFKCWLSWNLGASTSWNPQGLSRAVMGLLYLLPNTTSYLSNTSSCTFQMTDTANIRLITKMRIKKKIFTAAGQVWHLKPVQMYVISGFHSNANDICALLGYWAAQNGNFVLTYCSYLSVASSTVKQLWTLKTGPIGCTKNVGTELPFYTA